MNNIKINNLILTNERDRKYIENYSKVQIQNADLIRPKFIQLALDNKYTLPEIMDYLKNYLGLKQKQIFHGEADYIVKMDRGHIQIINDPIYGGCYWHQIEMARSLDVDVKTISKYIIHHKNMVKDINNIDNLWLFPDRAIHLAFHQLLKKNPDADIEQFTKDYIEDILNVDNMEVMKRYLKLLDKLQEVQRHKKIL